MLLYYLNVNFVLLLIPRCESANARNQEYLCSPATCCACVPPKTKISYPGASTISSHTWCVCVCVCSGIWLADGINIKTRRVLTTSGGKKTRKRIRRHTRHRDDSSARRIPYSTARTLSVFIQFSLTSHRRNISSAYQKPKSANLIYFIHFINYRRKIIK